MAERVIAEKDIVAGEIAEHAVRPVEHRRFDKYELLAPEAEAVAGFYGLKFQSR
jgi:hypothetical protein